jgi:hypothetical protein
MILVFRSLFLRLPIAAFIPIRRLRLAVRSLSVRWAATAAVRPLPGPLAGLLVHVEPALVAVIPAGDPRVREVLGRGRTRIVTLPLPTVAGLLVVGGVAVTAAATAATCSFLSDFFDDFTEEAVHSDSTY